MNLKTNCDILSLEFKLKLLLLQVLRYQSGKVSVIDNITHCSKTLELKIRQSLQIPLAMW